MATKKFKCKVCGYVHEGNEAPQQCPICNAPKSEFEEIVEKKKGLDTGSNVYTIVYAAVMVVIVAFLLVFVSSTLKARQDANVVNDTKKQILTSLNMRNVSDVAATYDKYIKADMLMQADGSLAEYDGEFNTSYSTEFKEGNLHVFEADVDGQRKFIIPMNGQGLWGAIWGYVAIDADRTTVNGIYFSHASETPGLGAEIKESVKFQESFQGKMVVDNGEVGLKVVKAGKADKNSPFQVDGVTGATMTSNGVDAMINKVLSAYIPFLTGQCGKEGECSGDCEKHHHVE